MDRETERTVWQRVRGQGQLNAEEALLPERLERIILEQRIDASSLRQLSGRLRGPERAAVARMAAEQDNRARELTALHYLLTGRQLRLKVPTPPISADLPQALRELFFRQKQAARELQGLQRDFDMYADHFAAMEQDARRNSRMLAGILQGVLPSASPPPQKR
jgi:hypothetical protein